jgi:ribosomal protein S18 acetylase RimI-like enzyme
MNQINTLKSQCATYEVVPFDRHHLPSARDLAQLHLQLLPNSPISLLGPLFARAFYYRLIPQQGLLFGAVAYVEQRPVGFIVATHDAENFMSIALRRHWLYLIFIVGLSVLQNPIQRLSAAWEALQIMRHLPTLAISEQEAELLSFGVLPSYRFSTFGHWSGNYVAVDLLNIVKKQISLLGMQSIRAIVDLDNTQAQSFYYRNKWQLRRRDIPGWRIPCIEMTWCDEILPIS